jgi:aspartate aminotransferase
MSILAGGVPVFVHADEKQNFKITPNQLKASITELTRLVIINSPSNPTGMAYTLDELRALGEVLLEYPKIMVATDDMYEHIRWSNEPFVNILNACPALKDRCIVMNGVSKAYSMTGWRIGYAAGPANIIKAMKKIQSQSTSNPTSISQVAAQEALNGPQNCIQEMLVEFKQRHDYVIDRLNKIDGVSCLPTDGTFYCFLNVQEAIDKLDDISSDVELAEYLIEHAGVALVPGSAFGLSGHARISIATSMKNLANALDRLEQALGG